MQTDNSYAIINPFPIARIIRKEDAEEYLASENQLDEYRNSVEIEATQLIDEARLSAERIIKEAEEKSESIIAEAKEEAEKNFEENRNQLDVERQTISSNAEKRLASELLEQQKELKSERISIERKMVKLLNACVHKIINEIPASELAYSLISQVLQELDFPGEVSLVVSSDEQEDYLLAVKKLIDDFGLTIKCKASEELEAGRCVLISPGGTVECGIGSELENISELLHRYADADASGEEQSYDEQSWDSSEASADENAHTDEADISEDDELADPDDEFSDSDMSYDDNDELET